MPLAGSSTTVISQRTTSTASRSSAVRRVLCTEPTLSRGPFRFSHGEARARRVSPPKPAPGHTGREKHRSAFRDPRPPLPIPFLAHTTSPTDCCRSTTSISTALSAARFPFHQQAEAAPPQPRDTQPPNSIIRRTSLALRWIPTPIAYSIDLQRVLT